MSRLQDQRRRLFCDLWTSGVALWLAAAAPGVVRAQVFEINDTGDVTVHDRPEVITQSGVAKIDQSSPRRKRRTPALRRDPEDLTNAASKADISSDLIEAVAWTESRLQPGVISPAGAVGEMQLMPGTARDLGVDPFVSRENFAGGATYLSMLLKRYNGDLIMALAAYNAGPRAVDRYGGVPPYKETQDYVAAILDRLSHSAAQAPER